MASGGSPFSPSIPFCRFASALIKLASTAKPSPPTKPSLMQRRNTDGTAAKPGDRKIVIVIFVTMDPAIGDLPHGDIHVRDGTIVAVGVTSARPAPR